MFGGLNEENFCSSEMYCLELDPFNSKKVTHGEDKRKRPEPRIMEE